MWRALFDTFLYLRSNDVYAKAREPHRGPLISVYSAHSVMDLGIYEWKPDDRVVGAPISHAIQ